MRRASLVPLLLTLLLLPAAALAYGGASRSDRRALGLKEALSVGLVNAVQQLGRVDGFFRNRAIKIPMPKKLEPVEKTLRALGSGKDVDDFVLKMNRAAEKAIPYAEEIFGDALRAMTIQDALKILTGGDTAATEYFRKQTSERLRQSFRPIVVRTMSSAGATRQYKRLTDRYKKLPLAKDLVVDIDEYVLDGSLNGLFTVIGDEERKIRRQPAARVTDLLKEVFGKL
ncbi:MAG: DUF4197 domain-containing protein [Armatimonadetes bacterium]|nr:DUF4197 domain-containing protein [Armatimonadota bacterium]